MADGSVSLPAPSYGVRHRVPSKFLYRTRLAELDRPSPSETLPEAGLSNSDFVCAFRNLCVCTPALSLSPRPRMFGRSLLRVQRPAPGNYWHLCLLFGIGKRFVQQPLHLEDDPWAREDPWSKARDGGRVGRFASVAEASTRCLLAGVAAKVGSCTTIHRIVD